MYEHYCLIKTLQTYPQLRYVIAKIEGDKRFTLAILFGSYAKRIADKASDIDIYIETDDIRIKGECNLHDTKISTKIGKLQRGAGLFKEIESNHTIVKGVEEFYERTGIFV